MIYDTRFLNFRAATVITVSAIAVSTAAFSQSSFQPAPRRITPRAASIIQVVGIMFAMGLNTAGIDSTGKIYPLRKTAGSTLPITICMASSRVFARAEISSPIPSAATTNGKLIASSNGKLPRIGT